MRGVFAFVLILGLFALSNSSSAAPHRISDKKLNKYIEEGSLIGGRAGKGFTLLNVRKDLAKNKGLERIILDMGDMEGQPLRGGLNYFQASIQKSPPQVVIDLHQVPKSAMSEAKLKALFANSPFVSRASLVMDPEDQTLSLILGLKSPATLEVFELPANKKSATRLVLDLRKADLTSQPKRVKK